MSTPERPSDRFDAAIGDLNANIRTLTINFAAGNSYVRHRRADEIGAAQALAGLTQEERDDLHRWARWLLGFTEGD